MCKFILVILLFSSCAIDCIDKKTGNPKASQSLNQSKELGLLQAEMYSDTNVYQLDSTHAFIIKNAWIENSWTYECIDYDPVLKKGTTFQFVIDAERIGSRFDTLDCMLSNSSGYTCALTGRLCFPYKPGDSLSFNLIKYNQTIHRINFAQRKFHIK